jgi:hypothetical protein
MATLRPFRMQLAESPVSFFVLRGMGWQRKAKSLAISAFQTQSSWHLSLFKTVVSQSGLLR